jgi:site-specific DNA recombinase
MHTTQGAISARVSSAQQAETHPLARQVAAWRERVATEGLTGSEARPWCDEGSSGATLVRPALARRRDGVASRRVARLSGPAPARLARPEASHVLLVDACRRAGVEGRVRNRAVGQSPEDALRLQVPGMMAADERATLLARHRRGQRPAARVGAVHVRSGAP